MDCDTIILAANIMDKRSIALKDNFIHIVQLHVYIHT